MLRSPSFGPALTLLLLAGCPPKTPVDVDAGTGADMAPTARSLTLLYTNDEHSHLFAFGPESDDYPTATTAGTGALLGGVARRQVVLAKERADAKTRGADSLTVSAGDNAMGTLAQVGFTSGSDYIMMKKLGYDVTCLGNHEFDFGPAALAQSITAATAAGGAPQIVSTNIRFDDTSTATADDTLKALYGEGGEAKAVKRYHIITTPGGLKVGFFGIMGGEAAYYAPFKVPVRFSGEYAEETSFAAVRTKIYADLKPTVDKLRNVEKVDLVVALSHSGVDLTTPANGDDYNIAQNVAGIDVIISGHSHTVVDAPIIVKNIATSKDVIVVQAGSFGAHVGRLPLTVAVDGKVSYDAALAKLVPVNDTTIPDGALVKNVETIVTGLESTKLTNGKSFLESAISRTVGTTVTDNPATTGELYFYKLGTTSYNIGGSKRFVETNLLNLSADAEFATGAAILGLSELPDVSIQAAGVIRADIDKGKAGVLSFGDAFRAFPLGFSPSGIGDGSIGYPLVHAYIFLVELKAAFEISGSFGLTNDSFFLGASGLRVTIDTTRAVYDSKTNPTDPNNGRVTKMEWNSLRDGKEVYDVVLFDASKVGDAAWYNNDSSRLMHVVTNLYIASFAASQGVTLKKKDFSTLELKDAVLHRMDGSEVKDYEAFAGHLKTLSDGNGGTLPSSYDEKTLQGALPRRWLCTGPACGK